LGAFFLCLCLWYCSVVGACGADPNYAYMTSLKAGGDAGMVRCVDLRTGEFRSVGELWRIGYSVHCIATGFGYVAMVTSNVIYIAEEANWRNYWTRDAILPNGMLNSCVLTKLLADEDGDANTSPEEVVLIVGSNGGAVYTLTIPKPQPEQFAIIDILPEEAQDAIQASNVDQTGVPEGKRKVLQFVPKPEIEIKQCLVKCGPGAKYPNIQNINCLVQGKGIYTDYLIGAPDYETRLLIFIRQYSNRKVGFLGATHKQVHDAQYSIFELIEQQREPISLILPIKVTKNHNVDGEKKHESSLPSSPSSQDDSASNTSDAEDDENRWERNRWRSFNAPGNMTVNSLNLAWAPWHHRSILAAGTDCNDLIIYDFDEAQRLMCDHDPEFIFDAAHSNSTILFRKRFNQPVRLLKFSPVPSIPILAVADMTNYLTFIDCSDWNTIEKIAIPGLVTGMAWALDASLLYVATTHGCVAMKVKKMPSLTDQVLVSLVKAKRVAATSSASSSSSTSSSSTSSSNAPSDNTSPFALGSLDGGADLQERLSLLEFGWVLDSSQKVSWLAEEDVDPPLHPKGSNAGPWFTRVLVRNEEGGAEQQVGPREPNYVALLVPRWRRIAAEEEEEEEEEGAADGVGAGGAVWIARNKDEPIAVEVEEEEDGQPIEHIQGDLLGDDLAEDDDQSDDEAQEEQAEEIQRERQAQATYQTDNFFAAPRPDDTSHH